MCSFLSFWGCLQSTRSSPPPPPSPISVSQLLCFSLISSLQMQFMLLFSRQGKLRLQKWYVPLSDKEKKKITRELVQTVLARKPKMCSFLEWRDLKVVYKRWAGMGLVREKKKSALWSNAHRIEYLTLAWAIRRPVIHGFMDTDSLRESGASVVKETMAS